MTPINRGAEGAEPGSTTRNGRHRRGRTVDRRPRVRRKVVAALSTLIVVLAGIAWVSYRDLSTGITTSTVLDGAPPSVGVDQNILIVGLDSRRDQHGRPLPQDILDAMHAGDESSGSYDADVLIVVHVPAGDGAIVAVSIPRDDYVELPGCPASNCYGKIKSAYRLAYDEAVNAGAGDEADVAAREQMAREAGRRAQIDAVENLLQIPIDHFVEITLAGFLEIARVVEPITVCLNEDTSDRYYSGAEFRKGTQQISADQAMAFVRQRRDANDVMFTDLDRTRRQQAFLASVVAGLREGGALTSPAKLRALLDVAKRNVAVDAGFELAQLIPYASAAMGRSASFYTLPVDDFRTLPDGEQVNIIDTVAIQSIARSLLASDGPSTPASSSNVGDSAHRYAASGLTAHRVVLDVINASGEEGMAAAAQSALAKGQFEEGTVSTGDSISAGSSVAYGAGAQSTAEALADQLGLDAIASDAVAPNTVQLTVGTDFGIPEDVDGLAATSVATAAGSDAPAPTNTTMMTAGGIPCVR